MPDGYRLEYRPGLLGKGKMHFVRKPDGIDVWQTCYLLQSIKDAPPDDIWQGAAISEAAAATEDAPDSAGTVCRFAGGAFARQELPDFSQAVEGSSLSRRCRSNCRNAQSLESVSKPGESEADFRARLTPMLAQQLATKAMRWRNRGLRS